ncbi:MAG: hypothetical protein GY784_03810, partial [Gammaproteobacteria bacterium]|nr:hypothetical protein [Gammaproteobacteria bacterium]
LAGLIDKAAELQRLQKKMQGLQKEIQGIEAKLSNENFVSRAPAAVVDKEKHKLAEKQSALASLQAQADKIDKMA